MITEDLIPKIEEAFGFQLYDWQKDYLLGKSVQRAGGRKEGNTFAYCLKFLLIDGEPIKKREIFRYRDEEHGPQYYIWFSNYCLEINNVLSENGIKTRIIN